MRRMPRERFLKEILKKGSIFEFMMILVNKIMWEKNLKFGVAHD